MSNQTSDIKVIETIVKILPEMTDSEKSYLLGFGDGLSTAKHGWQSTEKQSSFEPCDDIVMFG